MNTTDGKSVFEQAKIEVVELDKNDVICTSTGTELPDDEM